MTLNGTGYDQWSVHLSSYIFSQGSPSERERLDAMARLWDPGTIRAVQALGIGAGQCCLEVGAGTGSVARALAGLVGPGGHVLAVDRDVRFLDELPPAVEVRQLDVMTDELPAATYDLVHARLLVAHLHPHLEALRRLAVAVAPGGWLAVEEVDWTSADLVVPQAPAHIAMVCALRELMGKKGGFDATYGRRLLGDMLRLGLTDESASYCGTQSRGTGEAWLAWQLLVLQFQESIVAAGLLTWENVEDWWELSYDPGTLVVSVPMFTVQARRPGRPRKGQS